MKRLGIFGTSGMARETGDIAYEVGYLPIYIAQNKKEIESWNNPDEVILEADVLRYRDISFVIAIGNNAVRRNISERFIDELSFSNLIHPTATFGQGQRKTVEQRKGVIVCAGVRFTNSIQVGDFDIFNQNAIIAHDVIIEDFVHIAPGGIISGNVHIESLCWIGAGVVVNQGTNESRVRIGTNTVIGSGAVVVKSCDSNAVYAGVPARKIR